MFIGSGRLGFSARPAGRLLARGALAGILVAAVGCSSDITPFFEDASAGVDVGAPPDGVSPWADRGLGVAGSGGAAGADGIPSGGGMGGEGAPLDAAASDGASFSCPDVPTAYVLEIADPYSGVVGDATALLTAAGFNVEPLPLDRDPRSLRGLIFLGSFVSESQPYKDWVVRYPREIYTFVDAANVLVEMTQADQTELRPPFLPNSQSARRTDTDVARLVALDKTHPLLKDVALDAADNLVWQAPRVGWETFGSQNGFQVVLAADRNATSPSLMEGAYAQGRFIMTAMALDKPEGAGPERDAFNQAFFRNLLTYTRDVCLRRPRAVNVTPSEGDGTFGQGAFTLAVLPDTQYYAISYPGIFLAQVSWIAANVANLHIPYVFHLGDIVDQNTALEWERASRAMWLLEGVVPYTVTTGNHDIGPSGSATTRDTLMNQYFSFERTAAWPTFGGAYEAGRLENTYHLFSAGGRDYIVLSLEWGPRDAVIAWADGVMAANPHRYGILVTHAYLNWNDKRYDHNDTASPQDFNPYQYGTPGGVNDGEQLWQKLVRRHAFVMTLNGHVLNDGAGYLASVTDKGNICHQMLSNYQFRELGGEGYMRLLQFEEDGKTVKVFTYSPLYDRILQEPGQNFTFTLDVPVGPAP